MSRPIGWNNHRAWHPEGLEPRSLPAGAAAGMVDVLRELGPVSGPAAVAGVEATALIPSGTAVTFRFEAEVAGHYTLLVRHAGDGLGLKAAGPGGSASIDPGPAGPFEVVHLTLDSAAYEVTASAGGKGPVFVDWELLLNSGVGQSAAVSTGLSGPSYLTPLPASATTTSTPAPSSAAVAAAHADASPSASASAAFLVSGPVGRPSLGSGGLGNPSASLGSPPPADRGLPTVVAEAAGPDSSMLVPESGVSRDELALAEMPWWERLSRFTNPGPAPESGTLGAIGEIGLVQAEPGTAEPEAEPRGEDRASLAGVRPDLIIGAIVVAVASRKHLARWRKSRDRGQIEQFGQDWQPMSAAGRY